MFDVGSPHSYTNALSQIFLVYPTDFRFSISDRRIVYVKILDRNFSYVIVRKRASGTEKEKQIREDQVMTRVQTLS